MNLFSLILYGLINGVMVLYHLRGRGQFYHFPFWAGLISLGWFYPQAIGGYVSVDQFPDYAYCNAMLFASLCTIALWIGYVLSVKKSVNMNSWLSMQFDSSKLFLVGATLCVLGFFFQWKLWSLPEEELARTQWTGAAVKYLFFASLFKFGFLAIWIRYLSRGKWLDIRSLVFLVPCFYFLLSAAILRGRRAEMMNLVSYVLVALWFVRKVAIPRALLISGLVFGLILINGIGVYRSIMMHNDDLSVGDRLDMALQADYLEVSSTATTESASEFRNYVLQRQAYEAELCYDYGAYHWNRFVYNYVPAQIFGPEFKTSLSIPIKDIRDVVSEKYNYDWHIGTTATGYVDAFGSWGWLGFIKFVWVGFMMGALYSYAYNGFFLGAFLYVYTLNTAMHAISHGTNEFLIRTWIYFFVLAFPFFYWARTRINLKHKGVML